MENKIEITNNPNNINLDYDEISPVTGNKCVIVEADPKTGEEHRMCMESGFVTRTGLVFESAECTKHEAKCTELMKKLQLVDMNLNSVWYPTFMQMPGGMLYCEGKTSQSWSWKVAKVIPIFGDERKKYPVPGKEGEFHTSRLDVDSAKTYDNNDFQTALDELYNIIKEAYNHED